MLNRSLKPLIAILFMCICTTTVLAADQDERIDRGVYSRLIRQVRQTDTESAQVVGSAMQEARESTAGKASLETQSQILALRNKRDRLMNRLLVVALRWGWEIPDFNQPSNVQNGSARTESEQVFEPADQIISARFAVESRKIASRLVLPVITIDALSTKERASR